MGAENIGVKGIKIDFGSGDRIRNFNLGIAAQAWLAKKHGTIKKVYAKLSGEIDEEGNKIEKSLDDDISSCQLEAMVDFIYAGLMRDAAKDNELFSREKVMDLIDAYGIGELFAIIQSETVKALPDASGDPTKGQATE